MSDQSANSEDDQVDQLKEDQKVDHSKTDYE